MQLQSDLFEPTPVELCLLGHSTDKWPQKVQRIAAFFRASPACDDLTDDDLLFGDDYTLEQQLSILARFHQLGGVL